jgi:hypothetical protein
MAKKQVKPDPNHGILSEKKVRFLRGTAIKKAERDNAKAVKAIKTKTNRIMSNKPLDGDIIVPDYQLDQDGFKVKDWKQLKRLPLSHDTFERFDNPISLQIAFEDYVKWSQRHPIQKPELMKSGLMAGEVITIDIPRPLTLKTFLSNAAIPKKIWEQKKGDPNFAYLCELIEQTMEGNLEDGALVGIYDASLVSKMNKIGDTVTVTHQRAINVDLTVNGKQIPSVLELDSIETQID